MKYGLGVSFFPVQFFDYYFKTLFSRPRRDGEYFRVIYITLAEVPGVARGILKKVDFFEEKMLSLWYPWVP